MERDHDITDMPNWKPKVLIIGGLIGALIGVGAAYLFTQKADDPWTQPKFTGGDGVKLGLMVLGLLRGVAELGD
jgi:hypothetical protein